jgi:hypothetical protein
MGVRMKNNNFYEEIINLKRLGEKLMIYNYPLGSRSDEDDLSPLKTGAFCVDGYDVVIHYSKADYQKYYLESIQIMGKDDPFLPFFLVCKIARKVLGDEALSFIEFLSDSNKVYCWTRSIDKIGNLMYPPQDDECSYEGFNYACIKPNEVNFY